MAALLFDWIITQAGRQQCPTEENTRQTCQAPSKAASHQLATRTGQQRMEPRTQVKGILRGLIWAAPAPRG